ncbi:translocation and assembly module lipoprotein TamL [Dyadobacter fanqingshengii]|uniref:BamA/TamA family outer membrane protein n=1 Tax=Dyadobacter fanqingshengii TaxID=2906443 RepID=A0A9X1PGG2_9BACT|nr:BamA/TamA family outer membrane protein [Dyadobacter fanqingshengii]MCF0043438.1 BamA/TamA family outer membrane protein [Dyadobacter fanqingshengii]USJ35904.1 BamA/TamA family outer membrane protein [Dyadobacter fanqingshengii]
MNIHSKITYSWYFFLILVGLSSCARKPASQSKSYYLGNSSIKGNQIINDSELEALIPQKPNRRLLGLPFFPYVGLYRFGELFYNREEKQRKVIEITQKYQNESRLNENSPRKLEKIQRRYAKKLEKAQTRVDQGNFWMRVLGEAPVYFVAAEVALNAEKMQKYLYNNGFFEAAVSYKPDTIFDRIRVNYYVTEKRPTMIRDVEYQVRNLTADSIINSNNKNPALQARKRYDGDAFEEERIRIETLLRNQGYLGFSRQNISYLINDTLTNAATDSFFKSVDVKVRVDMPGAIKNGERYKINSVHFEVLPPSGSPDSLYARKDTVNFRGINYTFSDKRFATRILDSKMQVRPGAIYSQQKERDTQQQLSLTDQFRFVNYSYTLDSTGHGINSYFKVIPLEKYQISTDVGLNVIQLQGAPGPFANLSYKIRNVFNGLENFEANLRGGIELVPGFLGNSSIYRSEEIGLNTSLIFPRLLTPANMLQKETASSNPRTQVGLGYNYVNRPEYTRTNVKVAMTYSWQPTNKTLFNLSLVDLNILNTQNIRSDFQSLLDELRDQGNNLFNSFQRSFVSDINFNFTYNTNALIGPQKNAHYFRVALESGGTSLNILPKQENLIKNVFGDGLQFYKYVRWNADYRRYWPAGRRSAFVARINSGAVYSYGDSKVPPYEKYFFAGGSNSLRAWLPRRLGPGSAAPRRTDTGLTIESPGEFLLEGNLEWRGFLAKFFGDINYALFIDAGNVWNLGSTATESQKFEPNKFFKEIAVGTGFGIRYDLSFFILRFDFGIKVYDPALQRFVLDELEFNKLFKRTQSNFLNVNLGVGYPF